MRFAHRVSGLKHSLSWVGPVLALALLAAVPLQLRAQDQDPMLSARSKGAKTAPVTVYEMADFQCPYCREFAVNTFPTLEKEYINTGKVRWIFINFPIPSLHANAEAAAEFAACAARQDRFWPTHDMLYRTQSDWEQLKNVAPFFQSQMASLGLKSGAMTTCLQSGIGAAMVKDDAAGAERSGAHSTPSFYIEGGMLEGAQPIEIFRRALDSVYRVKTRRTG